MSSVILMAVIKKKLNLFSDLWPFIFSNSLSQPTHVQRTLVQAAVETAIAAGYRHIDTAFSYKNEVDIGKALRSKMDQGIIRREDMFIVSKVRKQ